MKYKIELDNKNYVSGIVHYGDDRDIYDDEFIYNTFYKSGHRVFCYHLVDGEFVLDEKKEQEEIAKEQEEAKKPTWQDKIESQTFYTAMMTDTLIEEDI